MDLLDEFSESELKTTNIKHLNWWNIHRCPWDWSRGAKTERYYVVDKSSDITARRVKVWWTYVMDATNRSIAESPKRYLEMYGTDGVTVILGPQDISKPFNSVELGQLNKDIRIRRITDLTENASQLPGGSALIDYLYQWYGAEIAIYTSPEGGTHHNFEDALRNETDPARLAVLNNAIVAPGTPFDGLTPMQLLSFQLIGAYSWT